VVARHFAGIPVWFRPWIDLEEMADSIRIWCPMLIPGLLQTEEYIRTLYLAVGLDEDEAEGKVTARLKRQAVLNSDSPVQLTVLIHEPVLYGLVGTAEIMVRQLEHVLTMSRRRTINIEIVRGIGALAGENGAFDIVSGAEIPDTIRMDAIEDQITDNRDLVRKAAEVFEQIRGHALNVDESRAAIVEAIEWCKSKRLTPAGVRPVTAPTAAATASRLDTSPA
jgi:hypothetical protein